jgi:hypothetical protein
MKKLLLTLFAMVLLVALPVSAFAKDTPGTFNLIEKSKQGSSIQTQAASDVAGYGTIQCYPFGVGIGMMECDWSLTLTKSGEAIQSLDAIFTVKNSSGVTVGQKEVYKQPLGGNGATYRDTIFFTPGAGTFSVSVSGAVEGRYAVYGIAPIKSANCTIF